MSLIIRFSGGGLGLPGRVIQAVTWSWCSHVEFEWPNDGRLLGALPGPGVCYRPDPTGDEVERRVERYTVAGGDRFTERVMKLAHSQLGKPYDWLGVIGFGLHRDWAEESSWFCSEFVAWCWHKAGYPLLKVDRESHISPRDLLMSPLLTPLR